MACCDWMWDMDAHPAASAGRGILGPSFNIYETDGNKHRNELRRRIIARWSKHWWKPQRGVHRAHKEDHDDNTDHDDGVLRREESGGGKASVETTTVCRASGRTKPPPKKAYAKAVETSDGELLMGELDSVPVEPRVAVKEAYIELSDDDGD
ncbi:hypothetical protein EDB86DRAFT_2830741 [Lactarius hatsudake]|nr:hypothetical protein EDB86DRAFT_2830741 [Lactarius hatsudake]